MSHPRDFHFDGMVVGHFEARDFPCSPGRYRYTPYRGPGHFKMQTQRRAGSNPRCYYDTDNVRVSFTVRDCPGHGIIELCDFETSPRGMA
jgi:hypothetical protein